MRHDHDYWRRPDGALRCQCGAIRGEEGLMAQQNTIVPVTVYSKSNCQACRATIRFLTEREVPFMQADATLPENTAKLKALGHLEAPVVVVARGGESVVSWSGFRPDLLARLVAGTLDDEKAVA